jgi:hypothetical protein
LENTELLKKAADWSQSLKTSFPSRDYRTTVMDVKGKSVVLTRYFKPLKPPDELIENGEGSFETAVSAHFQTIIWKIIEQKKNLFYKQLIAILNFVP